MNDNSFQTIMSDPRVKNVHDFDDLPAIRKITRFQAWALADVAGINYPQGATRDEVIALLERAIINGLDIAKVAQKVLEKENKIAESKLGPPPLPSCVICGSTIETDEAYGEGRNGRFHLSCVTHYSTSRTVVKDDPGLLGIITKVTPLNQNVNSDLRIGTLRNMAKERGHKLSRTMTKQDLLTLLGM